MSRQARRERSRTTRSSIPIRCFRPTAPASPTFRRSRTAFSTSTSDPSKAASGRATKSPCRPTTSTATRVSTSALKTCTSLPRGRAMAGSSCSCPTAACALGSGHIWLVPAAAGGMNDAQSVVVEQTLYRARPDVSIDGKRFVYSSTRGAADQFSNLYVQPVAGGEPYKLTFFEHDAFHPRWSPDGESIAYIDNREGLPQLALLEVYGGANRHRAHRRSPLEAADGNPVGSNRRRERTADRRTHPSHGVRREVLRARRRVCARERGG